MSEQIYAGTAQYNLIYIFAIPDESHKDYLKIGMTSFSSASSFRQLEPNCEELNHFANIRIKQITQTALNRYQLLHTELARKQVRLIDGTVEAASFNDHDVHEVLDRSGYDVHKFYDSDRDSEWYKVTLGPAIAAIKAVKEGRNVLAPEEKELDTSVGSTKEAVEKSHRLLFATSRENASIRLKSYLPMEIVCFGIAKCVLAKRLQHMRSSRKWTIKRCLF